MKRHIIGRIVIGLFVLAALAGVGVLAYQAGLTQGAAVQLGAAGAAGVAGADPRLLVPGMGYGLRGPMAFGLGFGLFGVLGLIFKVLVAFFLISLVLRLIFRPHWGRGPWGHGPWGHHGSWAGDQGQNVPPMFAEWHRRAHGEPPAAETPAAQPPAA